LKINKIFKLFYPFIFALFLFLFYLVIYNSTLKSDGYLTAILVFSAALGWSAVINFSNYKIKFLLFFYITISIFLPVIYIIIFKKFYITNIYHYIAFAIIILGIFGLKIFISYSSKKEVLK